ncbi:hypothetical protein MCEMSEM47_00738 [Burkholderiales bacterium]
MSDITMVCSTQLSSFLERELRSDEIHHRVMAALGVGSRFPWRCNSWGMVVVIDRKE